MSVPDISTSTPRSRRVAGPAVLGALGLATLALLTACSSSSTGSPAAAGTPSAAPSGAAGPAGARGPAASGLIAAADGSTLQVQSRQDGQVAVTWSAATRFTQQVTVAASAIRAGDCVTAVATSGSTTGTSFTATTVRVSAPVDGSCAGGFGAGGFGGGGGARPSGVPSGAPNEGTPPSGMPTGGAGAAGRPGAIASGSVVSVSGSTLVVAARRFGAETGSGTPSATATPTTTNETVTLAASTTITEEQAATAAAAKVGRCATAEGKADSTGAVTATSIAVTDAVDGACTGGFGGFAGRPGSDTSGGTNG